jgi:hypothetical protein
MQNPHAVDDGDERCAAFARVLHGLEAAGAPARDEARDARIPGDEIFVDPFDLRSASSR